MAETFPDTRLQAGASAMRRDPQSVQRHPKLRCKLLAVVNLLALIVLIISDDDLATAFREILQTPVKTHAPLRGIRIILGLRRLDFVNLIIDLLVPSSDLEGFGVDAPRDPVNIGVQVVNVFAFLDFSSYTIDCFVRVHIGRDSPTPLKILQQFEANTLVLLAGALPVDVKPGQEII